MSKDGIIWEAFSHGHPVVWAMLLAGAALTTFYIFRQVYLTFFGEFRGTHEQEHHLHESPWLMTVVLIVLAALSVGGGFVMMPHFITEYAPFANFLAPVFASSATQALAANVAHEHWEAWFALMTLTLVAASWWLADLTYRTGQLDPEGMSAVAGGLFYRLSLNKYYVDEAYDFAVVQPYLILTRALAWFDLNIIDGVVNLAATITVAVAWLSGLFDLYIVDGLVNLAANATLAAGGRLRRLQTGSINGYLYGVLAAVMVILIVRAILRS
jgi:NADH-quinone oxidoreductase subunit L